MWPIVNSFYPEDRLSQQLSLSRSGRAEESFWPRPYNSEWFFIQISFKLVTTIFGLIKINILTVDSNSLENTFHTSINMSNIKTLIVEKKNGLGERFYRHARTWSAPKKVVELFLNLVWKGIKIDILLGDENCSR